MNAVLEQYPGLRQPIYLVFALLSLALGAVATVYTVLVRYGSVPAVPQWVAVAAVCLSYLAGGIGYQAHTNTTIGGVTVDTGGVLPILGKYPTVRQMTYATFGLVGFALGTVMTVFAALNQDPLLLQVISAVFGFLSGAVGYTAHTNTVTSKPVAPATVVNVQATAPVAQ